LKAASTSPSIRIVIRLLAKLHAYSRLPGLATDRLAAHPISGALEVSGRDTPCVASLRAVGA
jgi:hypothetical protein